MKKWVFFLGVLIASNASGSPPSDSLSLLIRQHQAEDSERVSLLLKYGKSLFYTRQDSMMYYADEALRIAQKIHWSTGIADAYQLKGVSFSYVMQDPANAIDYYHKALEVNTSLNRPSFEWQTLANIALLHYDQQEYPEALEFYEKAEAVLSKLENKRGEAQLLMNIGQLYYDMGKPDEAMENFNKSLELSRQNRDSLIEANVLNSIGYVFLEQKKYPEAIRYVNQGKQIAELTNNKITRAASLVYLSLSYLGLKSYISAEKFAKEGLELSKQVGNLQFQRQSWFALQKIYEETGKYHLSLDAYKSYIQLNDSLISTEKKKEIMQKEMQYQFDKNKALATAELNRQTTIKKSVITGAIALIAGLLAFLILYKKRRDAEAKKKVAEFQALVTETEMKALRAQMNPHFIFNSLNAISDYILKNKPQIADEYLGKFASLMRMVLENSEKKEILLSDEIKALTLYMELEAIRLDHRFTFETQLGDEIDADNILIPPLLLQPFVENSIRHGIEESRNSGKVIIRFQKEGEVLTCNIEDNGIGVRASKELKTKKNIPNHKSLGIKITQSRIHIINQEKKSSLASLNIYENETGTDVEIKLPLVYNF
ncbi:MAG: tetratricopeptide repeat protein [Chitinophagaceae bacterium]|nr:tetratricopeptide repeat protein [Chitinophagaceae bacterium]